MARGVGRAGVAASSEWIDDSGVRQPGGEVHAWRAGQNQTVCGRQLSRSRLRRFPHVPFDYRGDDQPVTGEPIKWICPQCLAATEVREPRWRRDSPRP